MPTHGKETMPLAEVKAGERARIVSVDAGRGLRARLAALGLIPGAEVEVMRNSGRGPFILTVRDGRLLMGRGMARKILVVIEKGE